MDVENAYQTKPAAAPDRSILNVKRTIDVEGKLSPKSIGQLSISSQIQDAVKAARMNHTGTIPTKAVIGKNKAKWVRKATLS